MALPRAHKLSLFVSGFLALILAAHLVFPEPSQKPSVEEPDPEKPSKPSAKDLRGIAVSGRNEVILPPPPQEAVPARPERTPVRPQPVNEVSDPSSKSAQVDPPSKPAPTAREITPLKPAQERSVEEVQPVTQEIEPLKVEPVRRPEKADPVPEPVRVVPLRPEKNKPRNNLESASRPPRPTPAPRAVVAQQPLQPLEPLEPLEHLSKKPSEREESRSEHSRSVAMTFEEAKKATEEGRALLRLLEHGKGPAIEIAWPATGGQRDALFRMFERCFGVEVALMDGKKGLYFLDAVSDGQGGLNMDFYSGFVRYPSGALSGTEKIKVKKLKARHNVSGGARHVRVFPRRVDALLLGGLKQLIGPVYANVRSVRASYLMRGDGVVVDNIRVDGRRVAGAISLTAARRTGCRV